jgi:site-specific DNA-methyltransferase (adenine-specific)
MINKVYNEPCLDTLKRMADKSIDCVITSPPYWQLRDYGYDGQWGLEPTFNEYLEHLWQLMDEIYRVLKDEGTCWVNLGDTYARGTRNKKSNNNQTLRNTNENNIEPNTKPDYNGLDKCLLLIPHRFAIGCIDRGWIVRNDIIWAKRNGMPESITDRFTKKHEYIFFMVKCEKYYFDLDAIRQKTITNQTSSKNINSKYKNIDIEKDHRQGMHNDRGNNIIEKRYNLPTQEEFVNFLRSRTNSKRLSEDSNLPITKVEHWFRKDESGFSYPSVEDWNLSKEFIDDWSDDFHSIDTRICDVTLESDDILKNIHKGKNPGSVSDFWDVTTKSSSDQHFASYNTDLIKKPILAGCPEGGVIYDPFMGTGTTAIAALRSNRNFIGSEMSTEYIKICENNIKPYLQQTKLF